MRFVWLVLALEIVVGVVGFALHLTANLGGPGGMWENFLYGAPIFSPLLFPNLALLAGIAVWVLTESSDEPGFRPHLRREEARRSKHIHMRADELLPLTLRM